MLAKTVLRAALGIAFVIGSAALMPAAEAAPTSAVKAMQQVGERADGVIKVGRWHRHHHHRHYYRHRHYRPYYGYRHGYYGHRRWYGYRHYRPRGCYFGRHGIHCRF